MDDVSRDVGRVAVGFAVLGGGEGEELEGEEKKPPHDERVL